MKKLAAMLCLSAMTTGAFAQGLINFANSPTTLISANIGGNVATLSGPSGTYLFGLLTSAAQGGPFTFAGVYGTNLVNSTGGRLSGGNGVAVNGWAPGATMFYELAGWSSAGGATTFNAAWVKSDGTAAASGLPSLFGVSPIGSGVAGGGAQSLPTLQLFGGASGIQSGFTLTGVPEPTSMALAGLGAAALLIFRRRK
jgi:hypothetical protein